MATKITADRRSPEEFWAMRPDEFNDWRKKQDFPRILQFFQLNLNGFTEWQSEFRLKDKDLIEKGISEFLVLDDFFWGGRAKEKKYLVKVAGLKAETQSFLSVKEVELSESYEGLSGERYTYKECLPFEPFLAWAIRNKIKVHQFAQDGRIRVTTIEGVDSAEYCRTYFLQDL